MLDVDDNMLGDLGQGDDNDELRRRQQQSDQARPGDGFANTPRKRGNSSTQEQPNGQNVFGFITEWISSVSFMKGIIKTTSYMLQQETITHRLKTN